jgi:hypothetical protein
MEKNEAHKRIKQAVEEIHSEWIKEIARLAGDLSSWSRRRDMPLDDMLLSALAKKGLSGIM